MEMSMKNLPIEWHKEKLAMLMNMFVLESRKLEIKRREVEALADLVGAYQIKIEKAEEQGLSRFSSRREDW